MSDWILALMRDGGYVAVAVLMFLENLFPPIPSEIVMPMAGFAARRADLSLPLLMAAGSFGSFLGAAAWYWIGLRIGLRGLRRFTRHHGRWLTLSPRDVDQADAWFERYGNGIVFFGRLVPGLRWLVSVPAGLAEMPVAPFLLLTAAGTAVWSGALVLAGWMLGANYRLLVDWLSPISAVMMALMTALYLYRVVTFDPAGRSLPPPPAPREAAEGVEP
ncbi:MAG: DedA family protein [Paenirhodobacter sp.]|uniref:DedA family protein n=1 Tax=Paenirhodobacter sp. TaxID=1965326 RepID=UPI003D0B2B62